MQTGNLIIAIPEIQKNQNIKLQNVYQVFLAKEVLCGTILWKNSRAQEEIREKYLSDLIRMQGFRMYSEEKGYLLIGI